MKIVFPKNHLRSKIVDFRVNQTTSTIKVENPTDSSHRIIFYSFEYHPI